MNIPVLTTAHKVEAATLSRQLVIHGTVDDEITPAVDGSKLIIGVTSAIGNDIGEAADVIRSGLAAVRYGADVTAGQPLTADAEGRAIPAAAGDFYIGFAEYPGAEDDLGSVWIAPGQLAAATAGG
ncbi:capsid cement protein [Serratia liquefaciens]